MTAMKKELIDKIVVDHRTNLVNHPYFILLEIWELDFWLKKPERKTRVVNLYDNWVGRDCT